MYLRDLGVSLVRRWYFVMIGIGMSAGLAFLAADYVAPTYEAESSLVLVPPSTTIGKTGNPYLFLGGLQQSVDVLTRALDAESVRRQVALEAPTGDYKVLADFGTSAPIIIVTANDKTSARTQRLLDSTVRQAPLTLRNLQRALGVRDKALITTMVVSTDDKPKPVQKTRYRIVALAALGSLFMAFVLIGAFDGFLLRRRARKANLVAVAAAAAAEDDLTVDELVSVGAGRIDPEPDSPSLAPARRKRRGRKPKEVVAAQEDDVEVDEVPPVDEDTSDPEPETQGTSPEDDIELKPDEPSVVVEDSPEPEAESQQTDADANAETETETETEPEPEPDVDAEAEADADVEDTAAAEDDDDAEPKVNGVARAAEDPPEPEPELRSPRRKWRDRKTKVAAANVSGDAEPEESAEPDTEGPNSNSPDWNRR